MKRIIDSYNHWYILFIIIAISLAALSSNQYFVSCLNSDFLYAFEVTKNFLQYKTIAGQDFPTAPYFFPDLLILMLLELITNNIAMLHLIYSFLFLCAYIFVIYNLFIISQIKKDLSLLGTLFAFIAFFFITPLQSSFLNDWPGSHFSVILFGLYVVTDYIKNIKTGFYSFKYLFIFMLTYLTYISDNLLFPQVIVPWTAIIVINFIRKKSNYHTTLSLLFALAIVVIVGNKTPTFLIKHFHTTFSMNTRLFLLPNKEHLLLFLTNFKNSFQAEIKSTPILYLTLALYNILSIIFTFILIKYSRTKKTEGFDNFLTILGFLYLSQLSSVLIAILAGKIQFQPHFRYLHTIHLLPSIALALTVIYLLKEKIYSYAIKGFILISLTISISIYFHSRNFVMNTIYFKKPYNETVQCVDETSRIYGLKNGLGGYWYVRVIRMLTQQNIKLSMISDGLDSLDFDSIETENKANFYLDLNKKNPLNYQFIITTSLKNSAILGSVGAPDKIVTCPGSIVMWLYVSQKSQAKLNNYFRQKISAL